MNKVILIGNLARDVEVKVTPSGQHVAQTSIAVSDNYTDKSGVLQKVTYFVNLVIWGKPADTFANYLSKGKKVAIEGKIVTRDYQNNEGKKVYVTEVVVSNFEFLTPKPDAGGQSVAPSNFDAPVTVDEGEDQEIRVENIPF